MYKSFIAVFLFALINSSLYALAQMPPGRVRNNKLSDQRYFTPFKPKRSKEQEQKLLPNPADSAKYADFLKQAGTGLIRLFPDFDCESAFIIRADEGCAGNIPGGSNYSFRKKEYTNDFLSDVRLKDNVLITDGVLTQGIIVSLGNVPLENLSLNSDGMKFLTDFVPKSDNKEAAKQYNLFAAGISNGKYEYKKTAVAAENTSYGLRVSAYKAYLFRTYKEQLYNVLEGDKRVDITIVLRVVRKDADGSITLLWKELERKNSVKIKVSKSDKKWR